MGSQTAQKGGTKGAKGALKGRQRGLMVNDSTIIGQIGQKPHQSCNKGATSPRPLPTRGEGKGEGKFQIFFVGIYLAILAIIWQTR